MLPVAPAVNGALDISDPVRRLAGVVVFFLVEDYVAVVLLAALHFAENDIPYANRGGLLLDRVRPVIRCCSLDVIRCCSPSSAVAARVSSAVTAWMGSKVHAYLSFIRLKAS